MPLQPGARLGPYEIAAQIGVGGMGEVYRATDTKLKRQVAIKVLPASVAADAERLARFQREAEVLASLNHPNIAIIHGLEHEGDVHALVMELVEGDDLSQRIAQGAIPVDEALPIAKQIAEALEAAHEQGIIHRDLKPANIKLRPDGVVKVLDFGLAKALEPTGSDVLASQSPTITTPAMTQAGMILGTAAYMSPEQAKGRTVDKRSDVWAFGAVLYEMLSGRRAFDGEDMTDVLGAVVRLEPDWDVVPLDTPPLLLMFLKQCLKKDSKRRVGDIRDVRLALEGAFETSGPSTVESSAIPPPAAWRRALVPATAVIISAIVTGTAVWLATRLVPPPLIRMEVTTSGDAALLLNGFGRHLAITPDGSRVVYGGLRQLFVRALDQLEPTALTGDLGATPLGPFVSPDGQWVGFYDATEIKKVAITGGPSVTVTMLDTFPRGATWGEDGTIIYATAAQTTGLRRISAAGGDPTVLTTPDAERGEVDHLWPEFLPGGQAVLFTIAAGSSDNAQIAVLDLETGAQTVLVRGGSHAYYVPTGHLVYGAGSTLRAVAFDLARLAVVGTPAPVLGQVKTSAFSAVEAMVAANGTLVYLAGGDLGEQQHSLVWVDRDGNVESFAEGSSYRHPRVSPDGTRVAVSMVDTDGGRDIYIYDLDRGIPTRLTFDPSDEDNPAWTADGEMVVFRSAREGGGIFARRADGTGSVQSLLTGSTSAVPFDLSQDGTLLFGEISPETRDDLNTLSMNAGSSPAGPSGRDLFYQGADGTILTVSIETEPAFRAGTPTVLTGTSVAVLTGGGGVRYDVAPDGRRLLMIATVGGVEASAPTNIIVVQNWFEELRRLVPTN